MRLLVILDWMILLLSKENLILSNPSLEQLMILWPNCLRETCPVPRMKCEFCPTPSYPTTDMLTNSAAELSTLLESVETTLNGLPDSLTDVPVVVSQVQP